MTDDREDAKKAGAAARAAEQPAEVLRRLERKLHEYSGQTPVRADGAWQFLLAAEFAPYLERMPVYRRVNGESSLAPART